MSTKSLLPKDWSVTLLPTSDFNELVKSATALANDALHIARNSYEEPYHRGWNAEVWQSSDKELYRMWKRLTDALVRMGGKPKLIEPTKPRSRA